MMIHSGIAPAAAVTTIAAARNTSHSKRVSVARSRRICRTAMTAAATAIRISAGTRHADDGCRDAISAAANSPLAVAASDDAVGRTSASSVVAMTPHASSGIAARNAAHAAIRPTACGSRCVGVGGPIR